MAWNTGDAQDGSTTRSMLYYYNGTSVLEYAYGPDSTQIVSLKAEVGTLWVSLISQDPYNAALDPVGGTGFGIGYVSNAVVLLYWNIVDGRLLRDSGSKSDFHSLQHFTSVPMSPPYNTGSTWVSAKGSLFHYDLAAGGFARSFGAESVVIAGTTYDVQITGVAVVQQKFIALAQLLTAGTTTPVGAAVLQLSGTGLSPNAGSYPGENKLISSRFDLGLPYVPKYWYSFETVLTSPLIAGQSVTMEYSLDDGTTWNACGGSPWQTIGQQRVNLTVQRVNPHVRYRVGLYATGGAVSPVVSSIAAKFAPSNPSAKVWTMTLPCFDQMMFRGQQIDDGYYGQDRMSFLFNIAQQSEVVTFYDNNEPITAGQPTSARTPHTVWVLSADDVRAGQTGGVYNPLRTEGEVQLVLWEVTA